MVALAASVVTKTGKALVSRQYMDMSRIRIEGLLAAFPKLVGSGKQHTFVETENVRYVYQPMENLYLLLITNKQSNILEDLETLRLLSKLLPDVAQSLEEDAIARCAFDLIFAFDEVISQGLRENVTISQVKQNCEMESHEEKLHKMIIQSKINDTKDVMKKAASQIDKSKLDQRKISDKALGGSYGSEKDMGRSSGSAAPAYSRPEIAAPPPKPAAAAAKPMGKGMQLGKAKKANDFLESLAKEGEVVELEVAPKAPGGATTSVMSNMSSDPVSLAIEEKLSVSLNKQGGVESLEVQGTMSLIVNHDDDGFVRVHAAISGDTKAFLFKTHPNIDKALYSSKNVLGLKDPSRPFPTGSELGILKWRMQSKDDSLVPITINCWPSVSGGQSYVNIEYESNATFDLHNVAIAIPLPPSTNHAPTVNSVDGDWRYDSKRNALVWTIELVDDSNRSGAMEFVVGATDPDNFYPLEVSFSSNKTYCDIAVESVQHTQKDHSVKYGLKKSLQTAEYTVA